MLIGESIKFLRKNKGMEQKELAQLLQLSDKTISSWECGRTEPKMGMMQKMADIFEVNLDDFAGGFSEQTETDKDRFKLSDTEKHLIQAYRSADDVTRKNVLKLLED